jgi:hypothetical protein
MGESIGELGQQMLEWYDGRATDSPRKLTINGFELSIQSAVSNATIHEVFDDFAAECRKRAGVLADHKEKEIIDQIKSDDWQNIESGIIRRESASEGTIVCIDTGRPLEPQEVLERVKLYTKTHDLADIGRVRALTARRSGNRTQVLTVASEGPMNLAKAFPKTGDAPGQEPAEVPRPPDSRRIFDTTEQIGNSAFHIYESRGKTANEVATYYRTELQNRGWSVTDSRHAGSLLAEKGQRRILVIASQSQKETLKTSLVELSR